MALAAVNIGKQVFVIMGTSSGEIEFYSLNMVAKKLMPLKECTIKTPGAVLAMKAVEGTEIITVGMSSGDIVIIHFNGVSTPKIIINL